MKSFTEQGIVLAEGEQAMLKKTKKLYAHAYFTSKKYKPWGIVIADYSSNLDFKFVKACALNCYT